MRIYSVKRLQASVRKPVKDLSLSTLKSIQNDRTDNRASQAEHELERRKKIDKRRDIREKKNKLDEKSLNLMESPVVK